MTSGLARRLHTRGSAAAKLACVSTFPKPLQPTRPLPFAPVPAATALFILTQFSSVSAARLPRLCPPTPPTRQHEQERRRRCRPGRREELLGPVPEGTRGVQLAPSPHEPGGSSYMAVSLLTAWECTVDRLVQWRFSELDGTGTCSSPSGVATEIDQHSQPFIISSTSLTEYSSYWVCAGASRQGERLTDRRRRNTRGSSQHRHGKKTPRSDRCWCSNGFCPH